MKIFEKLHTKKKIIIQMKRKWYWIGHALRKPYWIHREDGTRLEPPGAQRHGRGWMRKKPGKWGRCEARLKGLRLTGSDGNISQIPFAPEAATGINYCWHSLILYKIKFSSKNMYS
jgi:hypothetical protein